MIRAVFHRQQEQLVGFVISGHAGWDEKGRDIVCAAVSALAQGAVIGLEQVSKIAVKTAIDHDSGYLECFLPASLAPEKRREAQLIMKTLLLSLRSIEAGHGQALQVEEIVSTSKK